MLKKQTAKRIKESIEKREFDILLAQARCQENLRPNTRKNLLRTFVFLYYTGMRLNELQDL